MKQVLKDFFNSAPATGILLIITSVVAMVVANSPLNSVYQNALHFYFWGISIQHWINDGLMAIFFFYVGLEVKRELIDGSLNTKEKAIFPVFAAIGGMIVPALIYILIVGQSSNPQLLSGWAIPAATDIAFALGVLALLGKRVPLSLKVFLLALAVIDDLGAIIIIALFYSAKIDVTALAIAGVALAVLITLHAKKVTNILFYIVVGVILWVAVYKSGIHATLAGVALGLTIPFKDRQGHHFLEAVEHALSPYVSFLILPIFAFANAGVPLKGLSPSDLLSPLPLGIALGLFLGKPIGIFISCWLSVKFKMAKLPNNINFQQIAAVGVLCGIGFTMSIFISSLAFPEKPVDLGNFSRLGVLLGSFISATVGYLVLSDELKRHHAKPDKSYEED